jgi:hypothetical protein
MTRRNIGKNVDPVKYLKIRIELLTQERHKNNDKDTHMILDKAIIELSIVLDLLEQNYAKAPL